MPPPARARAAIRALREHKRLVDEAITKLEAYAETHRRIQKLVPRDELIAALALANHLDIEPPRPHAA